MMGDRVHTLLEKLGSFRYVLLVAAVGLLLILWPSPNASAAAVEGGEDGEEARIAGLLTSIEGVGQAHVLLSENGAVVVCPGADDASVCLRVTQAVKCYTGLGADDVRIFKTESDGG